jgi:hypothetical protein
MQEFYLEIEKKQLNWAGPEGEAAMDRRHCAGCGSPRLIWAEAHQVPDLNNKNWGKNGGFAWPGIRTQDRRDTWKGADHCATRSDLNREGS